jgi:hypothetical protein
MMKRLFLFTLVCVAAYYTVTVRAQSAVMFPGAVGFSASHRNAYEGSASPQICRVTNLNNSGDGSLREALEGAGGGTSEIDCNTNPRLVIFETSGTITLTTPVTIGAPYVYVAGQTAPNPGILVKGARINIQTNDVLIRHLRVRPGDVSEGSSQDGIQITQPSETVQYIFLDHVSVSWAEDENVDFFAGDNMDLQYSIIGEPLRISPQCPSSAACSNIITWDGVTNLSFIGNLMSQSYDRCPIQFSASALYLANNVIYNCENSFNIFGCPGGGHGCSSFDTTAIGNVFVDGDASINLGIGSVNAQSGSRLYIFDSLGVGITTLFVQFGGIDPRVGSPPLSVSGYTPLSSSAARVYVEANAGAYPAFRDSVDLNIVDDETNRTGSHIDDPADVGGYPSLATNTIDHSAGAKPRPVSPHSDTDADGFTDLEEWLESYACEVENGSNCFATTWSLWSVGVGASNSVDTAATTIATSTTLAITTGQLVVVCTSNSSDQPASVADGGGNTLTSLQRITNGITSVQLHYHVAPATATRTYTATFGASANTRRIYALPYTTTGETPVLEPGAAIGQTATGTTITSGNMTVTGTQTLMAVACARANGGPAQGSPHEINEVVAQFTDSIGGVYIWTSVNLSSFTGDLDTDIPSNIYWIAAAAFESAPEAGGSDGATAVSTMPRATSRFKGRTR